ATTPEQKRVLKTCLAFAEKFEAVEREGASLVLCGSVGTGKTHLAAAIAKRVLIDAGPHAAPKDVVQFVTTINAVRRIHDTFRRDSEVTESQAIASLVKPRLLILDEVGVQRGTENEKLLLFDILDGRYAAMKPTVIISNLEYSELVEYLGPRVLDRLEEGNGARLGFTWESYRQAATANVTKLSDRKH
ncbi:MAG: ATP-binding protein, partial [Pseudomonadota bacterium]